MKQEAEAHAEEDKKKRELIDLRNTADQMIYTAQKSIKDAGDKVTPEVKQEVEEKIKALEDVKDKEDQDQIKKATEELSGVMQKIGQAMADSAGSTESSSEEDKAQAEQTEQTEEKVRDADYQEGNDQNQEGTGQSDEEAEEK